MGAPLEAEWPTTVPPSRDRGRGVWPPGRTHRSHQEGRLGEAADRAWKWEHRALPQTSGHRIRRRTTADGDQTGALWGASTRPSGAEPGQAHASPSQPRSAARKAAAFLLRAAGARGRLGSENMLMNNQFAFNPQRDFCSARCRPPCPGTPPGHTGQTSLPLPVATEVPLCAQPGQQALVTRAFPSAMKCHVLRTY